VRIIIILFAIFLNGCALVPGGEDDSSDAGGGQTKVHFVDSNRAETDWWVTDRPDVNKVDVSPTAARTIGLSLVGSLVLSPSIFLPTQDDYQKVALQFLSQTSRSGCKLVSGLQVAQYQYRFGYDCSANK
jgi:uncharacterized protein YceK